MAHSIISRSSEKEKIEHLLAIFPVTSILGPRQAGKTTIARSFPHDHFFDLENPRDLIRLEQPLLALEKLEGLIIIDEIQRKPELFPLLRYLVDTYPNQRYLILGSASSTLKEQSGESLAGRIGYHYLSGFNLIELEAESLDQRWTRGGFPRSFLAASDKASFTWRDNFVSTFLEKDLAAIGSPIKGAEMFRFWIMLSHYHGQILNVNELSRAFDIRDKLANQYISALEDTFMVRRLFPWYVNLKKRLVKRPKLYIRDSGIYHSLQSIHSLTDLSTNPKIGASWEGFALEELISYLDKKENEVFFYGTHNGMELDLFWTNFGKSYGAEFKYQDAPKTTKSMHQAIEDLSLEHLWVLHPGDQSYSLTAKITALSIHDLHQIPRP